MGSAERGAHSVGQSTPPTGLRMEAIKKKMQAMKVEKDNLCDRCDEVEQKCKEAHIRQEKAEEECTELSNKAKTLETDDDKYGEKLSQQILAQEAKEAQVEAAELEFNRLNRRVGELEEDLRSLRTSTPSPSRSTTRPPLRLMTATVWPRCSPTGPLRMRPR